MAIESNNITIPQTENYNIPQVFGTTPIFQPYQSLYNQTYFNVLILCYKNENSVDMIYQSQNPFVDEQSAIHYMKYMSLRKAMDFADADTKISSIEDKSDNKKYYHRYYKIHVNGNLFVEGFVHSITVIDINTIRYRGHIIKNDIDSSRITAINECYPYTSIIPEFERDTTQFIWYKKVLQYIDKALEDARINSEYRRRNNYLRQRQAEGIAAAKKRGVYKGRKCRELPEFDKVVKQWRNKEITAEEAMKRLGISKTTFYRKVKEAGL